MMTEVMRKWVRPPHFDGVNRLPCTTVPHGFNRAEWIIRLGTLIEQADETSALHLRRWRANLEAIEERHGNNKRSNGEVHSVCEETFWSRNGDGQPQLKENN